MSIFQVLWVFTILGSILFLVVITTKYIGNKTKKAMKGQYISIIESVNIGLDKQILLLKAGDEFVLIASAGKSIQYLTTVKLNEYEENESLQQNNVFVFKDFFEKYLKNFNAKKNEKADLNIGKKEYDGQSGKSAVKENLNRLRAITSKLDGTDKKNPVGNGVEDTNEK
ncbi:MAG: flagellar biosynthetic protein FliO [Clostridiales bacterium]|jgi:flagellar protein FliO/FliZ|nr:flagellar biosynthetic protein FliO [Eubacteriales bacterium]MDH7565012.1 flagellar biosynthetic protein FliO [Clostridiales bacterium]